MNYSQKEKRKPTAIRITKLSFVLLTSALLVLSSIAAVQLLATNNNVAFAQSSSITVTGTCDYYSPELGSPDQLNILFIVEGPQPNTFYYYIEIEESTGRVISSDYYDNFADGYGVSSDANPGETYSFSWYQDFDGDYNDVGIEESELVASDSVTCTTSPPPEDGGDTGGGDTGGGDDEEEQPPLTEQFDNQGQCIAYADANPDSDITREDCNAAFVPGGGCQVTEETEETLEEVCTGGGAFSSDDDPSTHDYYGGGGGHGTCTLDKSTDIASCTSSGGGGSGEARGGGGGRSVCTYNNPTGEQDCSFEAGGGSSKPVPDEEG